MAGRLGIDFGTSNTVVAVWDQDRQEGVPLHIPDYGRQIHYRHADKPGEQISVVPSLIHYAPEQRRWLGKQVLSQDLYDSPRTFRWMKRYIARRSPVKTRIDGRDISHLEAGKDFLTAVLTFAAAELSLRDEEIALTVPVEAFEHYENWLVGVAEAAGMPRFRLLDEASAAALGYGAWIQPGEVYVILDRKSTRLNSSHVSISYAVFCLKKKPVQFIFIFSNSTQSLRVSARISTLGFEFSLIYIFTYLMLTSELCIFFYLKFADAFSVQL